MLIYTLIFVYIYFFWGGGDSCILIILFYFVALGQAVNLADSLVKFPQACLLADRISAFNSIYNARSFEEAIAFEIQNASSEILQV